MKKFLKFPSLIKNFVLIYRLAIFGVIFAGIFFIKFSLDQKQKEIEDKMASAALQISKSLSYDIDYVKYQLFYAAKQIVVIHGDKEKVNKLLSTFVTSTNSQIDVALTWNAFSWIDNKNKLIVDGTSGIITKPIDLSDRSYLKETSLNAETMVLGKPVYGALSQRLIIPAGVGVFSPRGTYIGTLAFGFDIEKITAKLEKILADEKMHYAFYKDNQLLFASENINNEDLAHIDQTLIKAREKQIGGEIISRQKLLKPESIEAYLHRFKNYPLEIVVFYDKEFYHQEMMNILLRQGFLVLMIIFSCVILFHNIYKKIVSPVKNLSKFAQKLLKKDFTYEMEDPQTRELRNLYNAMNLLRETFKREEMLVEQLKLANQKIAQENFNKSEFLSAISHDIRNPLAAIVSFAQFINDEETTPESKKEMAHDIEMCAQEALLFINDLMDVTQVASGEFSIDLSKKINVGEVIKRSIRVNQDFARKRNIEIAEEIDENLPEINLDARRLKQILVNLINNSIKYSKDNTKIKISARISNKNSQKKLQIIVADQGFGMSQEQVKKALQKFGRIQNENSDKVDSFGLGLPLVKQLVDLQSGEMKIESEEGVGTRIILTFNY